MINYYCRVHQFMGVYTAKGEEDEEFMNRLPKERNIERIWREVSLSSIIIPNYDDESLAKTTSTKLQIMNYMIDMMINY